MADKKDNWGSSAQFLSGATPTSSAQPMCRCSVCRIPDEKHAARHAKQTGHAEFEEYIPQPGDEIPVEEPVKPKYTDEEREAQVQRLQAMIKEKKEQKKEIQEQAQLAKELDQREQARQASETREQLAEQKRIRDIENAKKEKKAEEEYATKVRAKLAEAQREREAAATGQPVKKEAPPPVNNTPIPTSKKPEEYQEVTLQIRQGNTGKPLVAKFKPTDTIATVARFLETNRTDGQRGAFVLSTPNPKKEFTPNLMETTLLEAQLVPRGVLIMVAK